MAIRRFAPRSGQSGGEIHFEAVGWHCHVRNPRGLHRYPPFPAFGTRIVPMSRRFRYQKRCGYELAKQKNGVCRSLEWLQIDMGGLQAVLKFDIKWDEANAASHTLPVAYERVKCCPKW